MSPPFPQWEFWLADGIGILFLGVIVFFLVAALYEMLGGFGFGFILSIRPLRAGEDVSHLLGRNVKREGGGVRHLHPEAEEQEKKEQAA